MFQGLALFCTVISAFAGTIESKPWKQVAKPVAGFADHQVLALAADHGHLYVGSFLTKEKRSGFEIYDLKTGKITEDNKRIHLHKEDSITHILVDEKTKHVWIATNNNLATARCYDDKWMIMKCDRSFIDDHVKYLEPPSVKNPSFETGTYDEAGGVLGQFKGPIFLVDKSQQLEKVYEGDHYKWPRASALTKEYALVGTNGDGLIVINRATKNVARFPDNDKTTLDNAAAVAVAGAEVYIGGVGLYRAPLKDFSVK